MQFGSMRSSLTTRSRADPPSGFACRRPPRTPTLEFSMKHLKTAILLVIFCVDSLAFELPDDAKSLKPLSNDQISEMFKNRNDDCSWEPVSSMGVVTRNPQQLGCIVNAGVRHAIEKANFIGSFLVLLRAPKNGGAVSTKVASARPLPSGLEEALVSGVSRVPLLFQVPEDVNDYKLWVHSCYLKMLPAQAAITQNETPPWAGPMTRSSNLIRIVTVATEEKVPDQCRGEP